MTDILHLLVDLGAGWCVWSLGHNLGHRWWHDEMEHGKATFYAKGEREHHRIYDHHGARQLHIRQDPGELFISFPLPIIAGFALAFVAIYGWLFGWTHAWVFAAALYTSMVIDHQLHILFHKRPGLRGALGRLQQMHILHHATHDSNYFFVSGFIWDVVFRSARFPKLAVEEYTGQSSGGAEIARGYITSSLVDRVASPRRECRGGAVFEGNRAPLGQVRVAAKRNLKTPG